MPWRWAAPALGLALACGAGEDGTRSSASGNATLTAGLDDGDADGGTDGGDEAGETGGADDDGDEGGASGAPTKFDIPDAPEGEACDPGTDFTYIWVANSAEGTVSKIDTETGVEEGRYRSSAGSNSPSRTTVNQFGDVLVANRGETGGATKIASTLDRCVEQNGQPGIQTSTGPNDVLGWGEDECVLWHTPIPSIAYSHGPRSVAWEGGEVDAITCQNSVPNPRVWVSWRGANSNTHEIWRLDGSDGALLDQVTVPGSSGRPYGGAVNGEGDFWVSVRGTPSILIHVDAQTLAASTFTTPGTTYGMAVDKNGDPWVVIYQGGPGVDKVYRFDHGLQQFVDAGGTGGYYRGIQIDRSGRAWVAGNSPCRLTVLDAENDTLINDAINLPGCSNPVGISIDRAGYVWVVDQGAGFAHRVDPDTYDVTLTVQGLNGPYTYSDMTGAGLELVVNPPG